MSTVISGIYQITNAENGYRYIGSAVNLQRRGREHWKTLRHGVHRNRYLQRAWNKYGEGSFVFRVLVRCEKAKLLLVEQRALEGLKPEYNICQVAGSSLGRKCTAETKTRISAANKGRKHTAETRAKNSAALTGRTFSDEHRAKLSAAQRGNKNHMYGMSGDKHPNYGKPMSDEQKAKLTGRTFSDEHRAKLSAAKKGKPLTADHKAKLSAARKGKVLTAEHRASISASKSGDKNPMSAVSIARRAAMPVEDK